MNDSVLLYEDNIRERICVVNKESDPIKVDLSTLIKLA